MQLELHLLNTCGNIAFVDSEDLTDAVDAEGWLPHAKTTGLMCMEKLSSKTLAKNNISKRKGQVRFLNIINIYFMKNFLKEQTQILL